jgi:predicted Fe-Mo cluster-binding NifX family protein
VEKGVKAVLTGNCGPNAFSVLKAANISVMTGVSGSVQEAVEHYKAGKYSTISEANVSPHSGMGRGK